MYQILCGNNVDILSTFDENSIDICITDPPYGMDIAGVGWDSDVPPAETWAAICRVLKPGAWCLSFCSPELYHRMAVRMEDGGFIIRDMVNWIITTKMAKANKLKPAHEPIAVAQKPIAEATIKANNKVWNTGYINTQTTRIPWEGEPPKGWTAGGHTRRAFGSDVAKSTEQTNEKVDANPDGRYPSNVVGLFDNPEHQKYFYAPRVSKAERAFNTHPTPKPISLMEWLIRVYTPEGDSVVLDPFCGSGTTGVAALSEGFNFVGVELSQEYCDIAERRIHPLSFFEKD